MICWHATIKQNGVRQLFILTTLLFYLADTDGHAIESVLQDEIHILNKWLTTNDLIVNCTKTKVIIRSDKPVLLYGWLISRAVIGQFQVRK